jgi:hypothetical protein
VIARNKGQETLDGEKRLTTTDTDATWPDTNPRSAEVLVEAQPQLYPVAKQPANPVLGSVRTEDDAFWLNNALDDGFFAGGAADMKNLDTNAILDQTNWLETPNGEGIDWVQWDVWFGNLDPMRPNIGT